MWYALFRHVELRAIGVKKSLTVLIGDHDLRSDFLLDDLLRQQLAPESFAHVGSRQAAPGQLLLKGLVGEVLLRVAVGGVQLALGNIQFQLLPSQEDVLDDQVVEQGQFCRQRLLVESVCDWSASAGRPGRHLRE